jgi:predicted MFS family arabinose efflux permease
MTVLLIFIARFIYPNPEEMEAKDSTIQSSGLPRVFWIYLVGAALVGAGFADFSLMAYHFEKAAVVPNLWVPIFYSIAMAASGLGSLIFGRLFDRAGIWVLVPLTLVSAASAPFAFRGGFGLALVGVALWGLGMGVHESIIPAAVATMVPHDRRPSAYGIFTSGFGVAWFVGSVILGKLYDVSLSGLIIFSVAAQLLAIPIFLGVARRNRTKEA